MERKHLSKMIVLGLAALIFPTLSQASQKPKAPEASKETTAFTVSEQLTPIELAPEAINRIHSSEPIQKINAPQALKMEVEYQANNAFVTLGRNAKKGVIYIITQSGDVFSLEIIPKKGLKAKVIQLVSKGHKARENLIKFAELDQETTAVDLIRSAFNDTITDNFNVIHNDQEIEAIPHLRIRLRRSVTIDGVPLRLNEYLVSIAPLPGIDEMNVDETSFLVPELTHNPTAISLGQDLTNFVDGKAVLRPGKYLRLFIVDQTPD
jgi:hypothetical protein